MTFAINLFGHMLAALMAFTVFTLLWRERQSAPRPLLLLGTGVLSGLAVVTEYPLALAGAILGIYGVLHPQVVTRGLAPLAQRAALYAAGVIAGVLPLLAYNHWAFGSFGKMSYDNAVDRQGFTGHDTLGLNSGGFFGITWPDPRVALELLISPRGLLALTPVVVMGIVGTVLLHRRGMKAEALTITAIALAFFIYDTGYWLPFGGGTPGPRFLIPLLPFLGVATVEAWRRFPATTLVMTVSGAVVMMIATLTYPLIGTGSMWQWWDRVEGAVFQHTIPTVFGAGDGWLALAPVLIGLLAVAWLGARATGTLPVSRDLRTAVVALAGWVLLALVIAPGFGERKISGVGKTRKGDVDHTGLPWQIVVIAAGRGGDRAGARRPRRAPRGRAVSRGRRRRAARAACAAARAARGRLTASGRPAPRGSGGRSVCTTTVRTPIRRSRATDARSGKHATSPSRRVEERRVEARAAVQHLREAVGGPEQVAAVVLAGGGQLQQRRAQAGEPGRRLRHRRVRVAGERLAAAVDAEPGALDHDDQPAARPRRPSPRGHRAGCAARPPRARRRRPRAARARASSACSGDPGTRMPCQPGSAS